MPRIITILFSLSCLSGCASSVLYIEQGKNNSNTHLARVHLKRDNAFIGGGNAYLITDTGKGAVQNAVMATGDGKTYYLGPALKTQTKLDTQTKKELSYFSIPKIGREHNICGFNQDESKNKQSKSLGVLDIYLNNIIDANFICPSDWGLYYVVSILSSNDGGGKTAKLKMTTAKKEAIFNMLSSIDNTKDVKFSYDTTRFEGSNSIEIIELQAKEIKFGIEPTSVVGELVNGGSLTWERPPGTLILNRSVCRVRCNQDEPEVSGLYFNPVDSLQEYKLEAGKDYYILMDRLGTKLSDKPF